MIQRSTANRNRRTRSFMGGSASSFMAAQRSREACLALDSATLAFEAGAPIYQNLNGPQLFRNWQAIAALRISL